MNEAFIILQQAIIIFLILITGAFLSKKGLVNQSGSTQLSNIIVNVVSPAVIFMSYQTDYHPERVQSLLLTFSMCFTMYAISIPLSMLFISKKRGENKAIERFCTVFSNCGFMGIPLVSGIYGYDGVFYVSAVIAIFNLMIWTYGVILMRGKLSPSEFVSVLKSPNIIALALGLICFFLQIRIPFIPSETLQHFANMNTPLAMLISGISLASSNLKKIFTNGRIYFLCLLKLIVIPLAVAIVLKLFNAPEMVYMAVVITTACPTAGMSTILALKYNQNAAYASELVAASTVLSIITLPLITLIV